MNDSINMDPVRHIQEWVPSKAALHKPLFSQGFGWQGSINRGVIIQNTNGKK
jgi:hypothetical protein